MKKHIDLNCSEATCLYYLCHKYNLLFSEVVGSSVGLLGIDAIYVVLLGSVGLPGIDAINVVLMGSVLKENNKRVVRLQQHLSANKNENLNYINICFVSIFHQQFIQVSKLCKTCHEHVCI